MKKGMNKKFQLKKNQNFLSFQLKRTYNKFNWSNKKGEEGFTLLGSKVFFGWLAAAIVIVFLVYLGVKMYSLYTTNDELIKASKSLGDINEKINYVKNSGTAASVIIYPPSSWVLQSFYGAKTPIGECLNKKYCLCICKGTCSQQQRNCTGYDFEVDTKGQANNYEEESHDYSWDYVPSDAIDLSGSVIQINIEKNSDKIILTKAK